jgi:two-component system, NtrC family, sensor histidine kinase PilS
MNDRALSRRLLIHIALRLVAASGLLGFAVLAELRLPGVFDAQPVFLLIASIYAISLLFIASLRYVERFPRLIDVHYAVDVLVVSAAVALTGGITSLLTSLYALPIVAASTLRFRRGALEVAAIGSLLYGGIVLAQYKQFFQVFRPVGGELPPPDVALYTVAFNVVGLFAVALLAGSLAERMRRANVKLESTSEQLADLQSLNTHVIDNLASGLVIADERDLVLSFNRSAVEISGHALAAALGRPASEVLQLPPSFTATLDDVLDQVRSTRIEIQYRRLDRSIDLELTAAYLPLPNGRRGYLYMFQDVTELKRLERSAQMQARLATVGEMAAGIAHEIRNPLAAMSGSMQILKQELTLSNDQAQLMDIVLRESERLSETIRSFLTYARPQQLNLQHLDLRRVVEDAAALLGNSPEVGKSHTIRVEVPPEEVLVEADESHIRQIIWNLASNGLRAMPDGGTLTMAATCRTGGGVDSGVLVVSDEGTGMAPGEMDSLFQPFRGSFSRGTGLGLAIVHRISSDYGAKVEVQSEPGHGTRFRITFLPVHGSRSSEVPESRGSRP